MPVPLVALVAAGAAAVAVLRRDQGDEGTSDERPDATDTEQEVPMPTDTSLSARTLSWQVELATQAPELDTGFLLRWIQRESDGNPAAVGSLKQLQRDGWAREAGIGQVYFEARTQRVFGVTSDELRAGAQSGSQLLSRELSEPERLAQTSSLIAMAREYIIDGAHVLQSLGQQWEASDLYCLAKLKHALPVLAGSFLLHAPDASSWDSFRAWLESLSLGDSQAIYANAAAYYPWARYLNNAQYTGRGA